MSNEKNLQTTALEQGRAKYAFDCALEGKALKGKESEGSKENKEPGKYKSYVKRIPMLIKNNGLGAAFAFIYQNKNEKAYELIYEQTYKWLWNKGYIKKEDKNTLMAQLVNMPSEEYRKITNEVMALFNWLRRFVDAEIE